MINHSFFASGRNLAIILLAGLAATGLSACRDDDTNYLVHRELFETKMVLTLDIDDEEEAYPDDVIYQPESRAGNRAPGRLPDIPEGYTIHYVVTATTAEGVVWSRVVSDTPDVVFNLSPGDYNFYAWADFVPVDGRADRDHWYFTDEPQEMLLKEKYAYKGSQHAKKAFAGSKQISVRREGQRSVDERITLAAPMGRFRVLPTKEAPYDVGGVKILYKDGIWAAHDIINDTSVVRWQNIKFFTPYGSCQDNVMAFDYLFTGASNPETFSMTIEVYDVDGYMRARARDVRVPVQRGYLTTVKGDFYNILEEEEKPDPDPDHGSGIGIDPEFDKSYTITITK